MSVVPQIAMLRLVPPLTPSGYLRCTPTSDRRSLASIAMMMSPGFGMASCRCRRAASPPACGRCRCRASTSSSARDVVAIDLVERAVAPAVERAPPHQPVGRIRLPQHFVGDRDERAAAGSARRRSSRRCDAGRRRTGCRSASWRFLSRLGQLCKGVGSHLKRTVTSSAADMSSLNASRPHLRQCKHEHLTAAPGLSSGVSVITAPATSDGPSAHGDYCLPFTAK